jgi:hypothetical protein
MRLLRATASPRRAATLRRHYAASMSADCQLSRRAYFRHAIRAAFVPLSQRASFSHSADDAIRRDEAPMLMMPAEALILPPLHCCYQLIIAGFQFFAAFSAEMS